jgi:EAL domain-containing protein (putative c-di-GMP-specific phosphodiesterase class I)
MRAASVSGARHVTASVGVALFGHPRPELSAEELLAEADIAMYDAKEAGRDRLAMFDPKAPRHERMRTSLAWVQQIESALEADRFVLHAQPILSMGRADDRRYELLLRMVAEDGDLIPPATFLDVAERNGLAGRIDKWVVAHAVDTLAEQHRRGHDVSFEVNLSATSVTDSEMLEFIEQAIAQSGVKAEKLIFEITETAAIVNVGQAKAFVQGLRDIGCEFAIDDFGAGFASFYYLKHLTFDYLKIDGEFIAGLATSETNQLVVRSVADIARGLGQRTIAEFVDDPSTLKLLDEYGVDYAQGYFTGRPVPLAEIDFSQDTGDVRTTLAPPPERFD